MFNKLKSLLKGKRNKFSSVCKTNSLTLDYQSNRNELNMLKAIFEGREYADYFPFYKKVTILDIGSHFGYFTLFAAKNTDSGSRIISIEPDKYNYAHLVKNINDCGLKNVTTFNCAVGGKSGITKLFGGKSQNHSIVEGYSLLNKEKHFAEIELKTLEDIMVSNSLEKIDFLKMDCEGAEYAIIANTPEYILDKITTISMEFHDLKDPSCTGDHLLEKLIKNKFQIVKYAYGVTTMNNNYGKIIVTKILNLY